MPYNNRGGAYMRMDRLQDALADFNKAIELDPEYADAWMNRGGVYYMMGQSDKAITELDRAAELNGANPQIYFNRALAHEDLGHIVDAILDYSRVIDLVPGATAAMVSRAYLCRQLAVQDCEGVLEADPEGPHAEAAGALLQQIKPAEDGE
ncbi:MAG TPA: hypothetical protein DGT21_00790 [Armatimonadetes bacterium]|nr:hypothetical protein [Armatimonadota bacterium]